MKLEIWFGNSVSFFHSAVAYYNDGTSENLKSHAISDDGSLISIYGYTYNEWCFEESYYMDYLLQWYVTSSSGDNATIRFLRLRPEDAPNAQKVTEIILHNCSIADIWVKLDEEGFRKKFLKRGAVEILHSYELSPLYRW